MKHFKTILFLFVIVFVFYVSYTSIRTDRVEEGLANVYNGPNGAFTINKCNEDMIDKLVNTQSSTLSDFDRMTMIQQISINGDPNFLPIINNTPIGGENVPGVPPMKPKEQLDALKKMIDIYKSEETNAKIEAGNPKKVSLSDMVISK